MLNPDQIPKGKFCCTIGKKRSILCPYYNTYSEDGCVKCDFIKVDSEEDCLLSEHIKICGVNEDDSEIIEVEDIDNI